MAHRLEVRVPFLDNELVDVARRIPSRLKHADERRQADPAPRDARPAPARDRREAQAGLQPARRVVVPRADDGADPRAAARRAHASSGATSSRRRCGACSTSTSSGAPEPPAADLVAALLRVVEPALHRRRVDERATATWHRADATTSRGRELTRARRRLLLHAVPGLLTRASCSRWSRTAVAAERGGGDRPERARRSSGRRSRSSTSATRPARIASTGYRERVARLPRRTAITTAPPVRRRRSTATRAFRSSGQLVPYAAFLWAGLRYDVFCFFFDGGLLGETPFWRPSCRCSDSPERRSSSYPVRRRRPARVAARGRVEAGTPTRDVPAGAEDRDEALVARTASTHSARWADAVLGFADLVDDLPRLDGLFLPVRRRVQVADPCRRRTTTPSASSTRPTIGTTRARGSSRTAVERLQAEGLPVELVLVEGVPDEQARRDLRAGGRRRRPVPDRRLRDCSRRRHGARQAGSLLPQPATASLPPRVGRCPIVSANPETLQDELRALVLDRQRREALGRQGREFALEYHSLSAAGRQMDAVYRRLWTHGGALGHRQARTAAPR